MDECGVCGGSGDSCALVLSLQSDSLAAMSAPVLHPSQARIFLLEKARLPLAHSKGHQQRACIKIGNAVHIGEADLARSGVPPCKYQQQC